MAYLEYRPRSTLYHYTSHDGFLGIIRSKRLWFSDLRSTNDPRELNLGRKNLLVSMMAVRSNEYPGKPGLGLSYVTNEVFKAIDITGYYCCCFSQVNDQLPMWRAYGADCNGLAIGFRPSALHAVDGRVQKVRYIDDTRPEELLRIARAIAKKIEGKPIDFFYQIDAITDGIASLTAAKHPTWAYEEEIRMIYSQPLDEKSGDPLFSNMRALLVRSNVKWTPPLTRKSKLGDVKYHEFKFGKRSKGDFESKRAIEEIIIGPNCELTEDEVTKLMEENGFEDFIVKKSKCEIR